MLKLLTGALIVIVAVVILVNLFASRIGRSVPFRYEQALMKHITYDFTGGRESEEMRDYLNELAGRLIPHLDLPENVVVNVHHNRAAVFNAYATFGGNVVFYSGLLEQLPHENALAMVVAHEISHVLHRDPIAGLGGGLASMAALMALTGNSGAGKLGDVLGKTGMVTQMKFSRDMERAADKAALFAVGELYGHVEGADQLFRVLESITGEAGDSESREDDLDELASAIDAFTTTHPQHEERINAIYELARENGIPLEGETTPLPEGFADWL